MALLANMNPEQKRAHALTKSKDEFMSRAKKTLGVVSKAENDAEHAALSLGELLSEKKVEYVSDKLVKELEYTHNMMSSHKQTCNNMISECTLMDIREFDKKESKFMNQLATAEQAASTFSKPGEGLLAKFKQALTMKSKQA